jgi:hypothetical protein
MAIHSVAMRLCLSAAISLLVTSLSLAQDEPYCATDEEGKLAAEDQRTVVIAGDDKAIFKVPGVDFSFSKAIETILKSKNLRSDKDAQVAAVQTLIDSFNDAEGVQVDGRKIAIPIRREKDMRVEDLLDESSPDGMHPIGLFNRFDQMPAGGIHCGEHRIVYAQGDTDKDRSGSPRFLLIFEAAVTNPNLAQGVEGCRPIADLWQSLKTPGLSQEVIAKKLEAFYFTGIPGANSSAAIKPVLHIDHFGNPFGQIRSNHFRQLPWQLREWHFDPITGAFVSRPVGTNPEPKFYSPPGTDLPEPDTALRKEFQELFASNLVKQLTDAGGTVQTDRELVNHVTMASEQLARFNDFVSNSHKPPSSAREDNPTAVATNQGAFIEAIRAELTRLGRADVEVTHVLNRAGTNSCGGCHQFSADKEIGFRPDGQPVKWPKSAGFVHIRENSTLSPLLTSFFLPDRCEQFNKVFFRERVAEVTPQPTAPVNPTETLSQFTEQFKSMNHQALRASRELRDRVITLERANERGQLNAAGRRMQAD